MQLTQQKKLKFYNFMGSLLIYPPIVLVFPSVATPEPIAFLAGAKALPVLFNRLPIETVHFLQKKSTILGMKFGAYLYSQS